MQLSSLFFFLYEQVHGEMFRVLHAFISKVMEIFPFIEATRPRSKSGTQALCSLHVALDKAKSLLQHCSECSKLYLVIFFSTIFSVNHIEFNVTEPHQHKFVVNS